MAFIPRHMAAVPPLVMQPGKDATPAWGPATDRSVLTSGNVLHVWTNVRAISAPWETPTRLRPAANVALPVMALQTEET